jgi:outer membrane biosynthesis protein TonB
MRPTFIHVLTGVLLGTALAGLLNVPGQVVAHQESIPPVRSPHAAKPTREPVVRVSPGLERSLTAKPAKPARARVVTRVVLKPVPAPTLAPPPPPAPAPAPPPKRAAKPKPKPQPAAPAPAPPPAPAKKAKKDKKDKKDKKNDGDDREDEPDDDRKDKRGHHDDEDDDHDD